MFTMKKLRWKTKEEKPQWFNEPDRLKNFSHFIKWIELNNTSISMIFTRSYNCVKVQQDRGERFQFSKKLLMSRFVDWFNRICQFWEETCWVTKLKARKFNLRCQGLCCMLICPVNGCMRKWKKMWNENIYWMFDFDTTILLCYVCFLNINDITINHSYMCVRKLDEWKLKIRFFSNPESSHPSLSANFTHFKQFIHVTFFGLFSSALDILTLSTPCLACFLPRSLMCHFTVEMIYDFSFKLDYIQWEETSCCWCWESKSIEN